MMDVRAARLKKEEEEGREEEGAGPLFVFRARAARRRWMVFFFPLSDKHK